jgi:hypothetical protein
MRVSETKLILRKEKNLSPIFTEKLDEMLEPTEQVSPLKIPWGSSNKKKPFPSYLV